MRGIPKGVELWTAPFDLRARLGASRDDLIVLLPAGVRPVKGPRFPLEPLERLRRANLEIRYAQLGPVLDQDEASKLDQELARRPWATRFEIAPEQMPAALRAADLVLNCSLVEGFSNAVAEALTCGRAVLASDIPGNRAAVGQTGLLYRPGDAADFEAKAGLLLRDRELRRALGQAAASEAARRFAVAREIAALERAYADACACRNGPGRPGRALPVIASRTPP